MEPKNQEIGTIVEGNSFECNNEDKTIETKSVVNNTVKGEYDPLDQLDAE